MKQKALPAVIGVFLVFLLASGAEAEQDIIWNRAAITGESVAFSPDGRLIAATMGFGEIGLFRVSDGSLIRTLEGHTYWVTSVSFSPDGSMIASGSGDFTIKLWRVAL